MLIIVLLLCAADCGDSLAEDTARIDVADLRIRDPFVLTDIQPWMVFCHEWVQIGDGTMDAVRLAADLSKPVGEPIQLFRASDAPGVARSSRGST